MRRAGATYEEIAKAGGGIASTVEAPARHATTNCSSKAARRLRALMGGGCTTVEVKSGYGLDPASELRLLKLARLWARAKPYGSSRRCSRSTRFPPTSRPPRPLCVESSTSSSPRPRSQSRDHRRCLLRHHRFHPRGGRAIVQGRRRHGLRVKLHAEQLSNSGAPSSPPNIGRCPPTISTSGRGRRNGHGRRGNRRCALARRLLRAA